MNIRKINGGYTIFEIIVVLVILVFIVAGANTFIKSFLFQVSDAEYLNKASILVKTALEEARSHTVNAKNGYVYGVHVETTKVVIFKGTTYSATEATNTVYNFGTYSKMLSMSLNGGGSNILFERLTGETNQYGTITVSLTKDTTKTKQITLTRTGLVTN